MKSIRARPPAATTAPELFRALADKTRLRLLNLLRGREICVCDLCEVLEESQPKISRHLAYLRRVGLVAVRQHGKWKHYRVERKLSALQKGLVACVGLSCGEFTQLAWDREQLDALLSRGGACRPGAQ